MLLIAQNLSLTSDSRRTGNLTHLPSCHHVHSQCCAIVPYPAPYYGAYAPFVPPYAAPVPAAPVLPALPAAPSLLQFQRHPSHQRFQLPRWLLHSLL
ncbi:hypothetical protein CEXT_263551 [Caerostris extrusa]|uniref:Uncharacterized protein n=1 Tax=Caerostris extrusa TaxID=172846 RepID=A0AAV4Y7Y1_CAEEX|nr:hypothetical protein CEXT_263551 [Caerostris extrusa]